jgi:hypothetical protein
MPEAYPMSLKPSGAFFHIGLSFARDAIFVNRTGERSPAHAYKGIGDADRSVPIEWFFADKWREVIKYPGRSGEKLKVLFFCQPASDRGCYRLAYQPGGGQAIVQAA